MFKLVRYPMLCLLLASCASVTPSLTTSDYTMKSGGEVPALQQGLSVVHADINIEVFPTTKSISGSTILTLQTGSPRDDFAVDLDHVFTITNVEVNGKTLVPTAYTNEQGLVKINAPAQLQGQFTVKIDYNGKPRVAVRAPWDGGFVWSKTPSGADWIATANQGEGCDLFWACIDHPFAEPLKVDSHITVPANLMAAGNGIYMGVTNNGPTKTYHWQTKSVHNTYGIALNIAPYDSISKTYQSIYGNEYEVVYYHLPESTENAKKLFAEIFPMLDFFERMIGPYPFGQEKAGFVETPHLGMEHQTINAYGNEYRKDEYGFDWLLQHEFAHEYFANQLTAVTSDHLWLQEGIGSYMQPLFAQYLSGDMAYKARLFKIRKGISNTAPIVSNKLLAVEEVFSHEDGPGGDIYSKGTLMLHSLRELIGDDAFFKSIRLITYGTDTPVPGTLTPRLADSQEFIDIVNAVTGKDYNWFFNVYLYQAALPELVVERAESTVTLSWKTPQDLPFPMPLEVSVNGQMQTLDLSSAATITVALKDVMITDPNSKVLKFEQPIADYQAFIEAEEAKELP